MLLTDFASEVYGFLDRAHAGPSLLANRGLHDRIRQLKQRLPVHHVTCVFEETRPVRAIYVLIHCLRFAFRVADGQWNVGWSYATVSEACHTPTYAASRCRPLLVP